MRNTFACCENRQKCILSEAVRITGWTRNTDPSVARAAAAGGGDTASRAMTTKLEFIRCLAKILTKGMVAKLARGLDKFIYSFVKSQVRNSGFQYLVRCIKQKKKTLHITTDTVFTCGYLQ